MNNVPALFLDGGKQHKYKDRVRLREHQIQTWMSDTGGNVGEVLRLGCQRFLDNVRDSGMADDESFHFQQCVLDLACSAKHFDPPLCIRKDREIMKL